MSEDNLTKIYINLPKSKVVSGESLWAEELGENLYTVRNVPFHAFGINFYDVVYAVPESDDQNPTVRKIHSQSGHKTLRVIFTDQSSEQERVSKLKELHRYKAYHENANGVLFAIDVEPEGDYGAVCDQLYEWEQLDILSYETCEARESAGFDCE